MPRVLIVAYGNPLRSDDGVAWHAAEIIRRRFHSDEVEVVTLQQLGPELAESVSHCECVIFVDAASGEEEVGSVTVQRLEDAPSGMPRFCHAIGPADILKLGEQFYGARPQAFTATIAGENFEHGESLSAAVEAGIPALVGRIEELLQVFLPRQEKS